MSNTYCTAEDCDQYANTPCTKCAELLCGNTRCHEQHSCVPQSPSQSTWVTECVNYVREVNWTATASILVEKLSQYHELKASIPNILSQSHDILHAALSLVEHLGMVGAEKPAAKRQVSTVQLLVLECGQKQQALEKHRQYAQVIHARGLLSPAVWAHVLNAVQLQLPEQKAVEYARHHLRGSPRDAVTFLKVLGFTKSVPPQEIINAIMQKGEVSLLSDFAKDDPSVQRLVIRALAQAGDTNKALRNVREWGLSLDEFPDIVILATKKTLKWLVREGKAIEFGEMLCTNDELRRFLLRELAFDTNQTKSLMYFAQMWRHLIDTPNVQEAVMFAQRRPLTELPLESGDFLELKVPIEMVGNSAQIAYARNILNSSDVIGLDVESLPGFVSGENSPTLLQLSCRSHAFLFDLLQFNKEMDSLLTEAFTNTRILKLGFGFSSDLKTLRKGFPASTSFKPNAIQPLLDLDSLSADVQKKYGVKITSLSNLCKTILGKSLAKSQQVSNWGRRPLNSAQMQYAALDASCLILLHDALGLDGSKKARTHT